MRAASIKKKKVGVVGASGRMGHEVAKILGEHPRLEAYLGLDPKTVAFGFEHAAKNFQAEPCRQVDVWIDFSTPEILPDLLNFAGRENQAVVSGTTGLGESHQKILKTAAKKIPVLWSSNMSLGVAVLTEALKCFAHLKDFDFQIEEVHHNRKKDKPSGTALSLQKALVSAVGKKLPEPLGIRGGGVYGIHKVWAMSEEEVLIFEHSALNRAVFAKGAVAAADWLVSRKPGLYAIKDLLLPTK